MSDVDNYILMTSVIDEIGSPSLKYVNEQMRDLTQGQFIQIDHYAGGPKHIEANIYAIATNQFPLREMAKIVSAAPWIQPEAVSIAHKGEEDDAFKMHHLRDLELIASSMADS